MCAQIREYGYSNDSAAHTHAYLFPTVLNILAKLPANGPIFELGCGNGATAAALASRGYKVVGVDPSRSGIETANHAFPDCSLELGSSDENLADRFGTFQTVLSLEVIEHVFAPARFVEAIDELLVPGGVAIISTPYHSYLKNLALAATGKMESHFTALWEGGHIKFWSRASLATLFDRGGFREVSFRRVGRVPALANSMIVVYEKRK